jgi:chlorophyllide a reductase subunit X
MTHTIPAVATVKFMQREQLRAEAAVEPDPVPTGEVTKTTQIIAIYGKGGIGKSFTLANLSYMMAQQGKKVLLIGCDPKSDTTSLLFGGKACPTIIETSSRKKLAGDAVQIGDVCFKRDGVYAMELGGPEVGRGCGGRGIIHGFETLEKLGFHDWGFDYVLLDFLGDVVCGGFGLPIARDMCQKVIVVGSNDLQSAVRGQQRVQRGGVLPQARRQRRRGRHGDQQGRRHRRGRGLRGQCRHPGAGRDPGATRTSAARAPATRSSAGPARSGRRCSRSSPPTWPRRRRCARARRRRTSCWGCSPPSPPGATSRWNPRPCSTWCGKTEVVKPTLEVVYDAA